MLGTARVLLVAPRLGAAWALALELPLMLAIAWGITGRLLDALAIGPNLPQRLATSAVTLLVLFCGEAGLAALLSGTGPAAWLAGLSRPAAWPGLAAQILACLLPILRRRGH